MALKSLQNILDYFSFLDIQTVKHFTGKATQIRKIFLVVSSASDQTFQSLGPSAGWEPVCTSASAFKPRPRAECEHEQGRLGCGTNRRTRKDGKY